MAKVEKEIIVSNKKGLHARPAALFVQLAERFDVSVTIDKSGEKVNGKSIMGILMLGAQGGCKIKLIVEGSEAEKAMGEFENFLAKQEEELFQ